MRACAAVCKQNRNKKAVQTVDALASRFIAPNVMQNSAKSNTHKTQ